MWRFKGFLSDTGACLWKPSNTTHKRAEHWIWMDGWKPFPVSYPLYCTFPCDISPASRWKLRRERINTSHLFVLHSTNKRRCSINQGDRAFKSHHCTTSLGERTSTEALMSSCTCTAARGWNLSELIVGEVRNHEEEGLMHTHTLHLNNRSNFEQWEEASSGHSGKKCIYCPRKGSSCRNHWRVVQLL